MHVQTCDSGWLDHVQYDDEHCRHNGVELAIWLYMFWEVNFAGSVSFPADAIAMCTCCPQFLAWCVQLVEVSFCYRLEILSTVVLST